MSIFLKMLVCFQMQKVDQQPKISVMTKLGRKAFFFSSFLFFFPLDMVLSHLSGNLQYNLVPAVLCLMSTAFPIFLSQRKSSHYLFDHICCC